jgi:hypothetical protein
MSDCAASSSDGAIIRGPGLPEAGPQDNAGSKIGARFWLNALQQLRKNCWPRLVSGDSISIALYREGGTVRGRFWDPRRIVFLHIA